MQAALTRHDALLRDAIERHGGHVFKTIGDAFCAVFGAAPDAVDAALAAQRALQKENWWELGPLWVRMAIHTGVAHERAGDYFGPTVNQVARLLTAAHGGQILLSKSTRDLVSGALPQDVSVRDLGRHRLKNISHAEPVYQLVAGDLTTSFPPLESAEHVRRAAAPS